jgi:osmotically-inducible protein OsmY
MNPMRRTALVAVVVSVSALHSACLPIAAGGLTVTALAAMDRRSLGAQTEDSELEVRVSNRLPDAIRGARGVSVTSYNRRVLLTGQVPDALAKTEAERAARQLPGVRTVHNELEVGLRASASIIAADAALTMRVKAAFVEQKVLSAQAVKVVTESSVVYLMGLVTAREGPAYAKVASRAPGVKRVVTLFEYITDEEMARILAR